MAVIDASAVIAYVVGGQQAAGVRSRLLSDPTPLSAPHLLDAEVGHVLRRELRRNLLAEREAHAALTALASMPLVRVAHRPLLPRAWELRDNLSFYDALYVALAEALDVPLITLDARLAGAPGIRARIELIG